MIKHYQCDFCRRMSVSMEDIKECEAQHIERNEDVARLLIERYESYCSSINCEKCKFRQSANSARCEFLFIGELYGSILRPLVLKEGPDTTLTKKEKL